MINSNLENNHGPAPISSKNPDMNKIMIINGSQARLSDEDGIIVLLTVNTR